MLVRWHAHDPSVAKERHFDVISLAVIFATL